jgi:hypothetical protein
MSVASYLTLLQADLLKSLVVVKYGWDPLWQWKMKDCAFLVASSFGALTLALLARSGKAKLMERVKTKGLTIWESSEVRSTEKKEDS